MSTKQNDVIMDTAIENVEKVLKDGIIPLTEEVKNKLIQQEYERLMEKEE